MTNKAFLAYYTKNAFSAKFCKIGVHMEEKYFAAVNSHRGFESYYADMFGAAERAYIIKGGPGTGKSYFMRMLAKKAESRGCSIVYIYCSSDPDSLDGILIDHRIAIFDGTAPHAEEASLPGARDELIDLGRFWNSKDLRSKKDEIKTLTEKKAAAYKIAYDCLSAVGSFEWAIEKLVRPAVLTEKMRAAVARYLRPIPDGKLASVINLATNSIGMRGEVRFSTLEDRAKASVFVEDFYETSHLFLSEIQKEAARKGLAVRVSHDPAFPDHADAVELCESGLLFTSGGEVSGRRVNMKRFIDEKAIKDLRSEYRMLVYCKESAKNAAKKALETAAKYHFALEEIYVSHMDFEAKERFTEEFENILFS